MGGFYNRGSSNDEDAEVENLLNQFQEESLLNLSVDSHRNADRFRGAEKKTVAVDDESGLEGNLLVRFANLKARPPMAAAAPGKKDHREDQASVDNAKNPPARSQREPDPVADDSLSDDAGDDEEEEEDAELENRLKALKAPPVVDGPQESQIPHGSSESQQCQLVKVSSPSPALSSSSSTSSTKNRSFSPMKLLKQLSMSKKNKDLQKSSKSRSEGSLSSAENDETSDANRLLASVVDEIMLEKKNKKKTKKKKSSQSQADYEGENDEEFDDLSECVKDFNVKNLKKELSIASMEEDRLSREAQEVIKWAKDAARLEEKTGGGSDESDLEELLRMEEEHAIKDSGSNKKKKAKGKKWSLF